MEDEGGSASRTPRGAPAWTLTLADLMTLLLAFFVLLYATARTDAQKFRQITSSLQGAFGPRAAQGAASGADAKPPEPDAGSEARLLEGLGAALEERGLSRAVAIEREPRGFRLRAAARLFFLPGSAELAPGALVVLDDIGELARALPHEIAVIGHPDAAPAQREDAEAGWPLAAARAIAAVRYLVEIGAVDPARVSAIARSGARGAEAGGLVPAETAPHPVEFLFQRAK